MKLVSSIRYILPIMLAAAAVSCSCDSSDGISPQDEKVSSKVKDWKAYNLGADHANKVIEIAHDEGLLQEELLEVRARISNIHSKLGAQSATDYERGFTEEIRAKKDSLARIIF